MRPATSARRLNQPPSPPFMVGPSSTKHSQSIILLHGLGNNGEAFGQELLSSRSSSGQTLLEAFPNSKFIFPTSRWRRSRALKRAIITTWFDKASIEDPFLRSHTQVRGLEESCAEILELVYREIEVVGPKNVLLGGISQGCATSLITLLLLGSQIAGYVGLCGYLPFCPDMEQVLDAAQGGEDDDDAGVFDDPEDEDGGVGFDAGEEQGGPRSPADQVHEFVRDLISMPGQSVAGGNSGGLMTGTPVFLSHGTMDPKINIEYGERAREALRTTGFEVTWKSYEGLGHEYKVPEGIDDIIDFIQTRTDWVPSPENSHEEV